VFEEMPIVGSKLRIDFYNHTKGIAVEAQGWQHTKFVPYFHGTRGSGFNKQLKNDKKKWDFCTLNKIMLVEIYPDDILCPELFKEQGVIL
jgi:very-short-patch-repair endonuclease